MALTERGIRSAKPTDKRQHLLDGNGLYLYISPAGKKTWYYVYYEGRKKRQYKIGTYPFIGLHEARQEHKRLLEERERGDVKPGLTFEQVAEQAVTSFKYKDGGREAHRSLNRDIYPYIKDVPIDELTRAHVAELLHAKRDTPRQYNSTKSRVSRICTYACQMGWIDVNPCLHLPKASENEPREIILTDEEIRELIRRKDRAEADRVLYFMLLTGQRGGECRSVKYSDIEGNWWTCRQIKGGKVTHKRVYLCAEALKHIGEGKGLVFDFRNPSGLATHCRRLKRRYAPHDIRRTCATILAREGFDDYLIHRYLGHSVDKLTRTYNQHRYDPQLREMAETIGRVVMDLRM